MELTEYIYPLCYLLGGIIAGLLFEKVVLSKAAKFALKTKWEGDDIVINAFRE